MRTKKIEESFKTEMLIDLTESLRGINKRLGSIDDHLARLGYKEVIDLDKMEELDGVDDSEEVGFTNQELENLVSLVERTKYQIEKEELQHGMSPSKNVFTAILVKLNKMLKETSK
jgi:hypothetical protein